jgi:UDP:flavonoid glycosyltransferase YjiC (YdhE family)
LTAPLRILVAAFGDAGHVFPAIALGKALAARGHEVVIETWEERREAVEGAGLGFAAAEEYRMFPPPDPESEEGQHAAEAAKALQPLLEDFRPHLVVSDILTLARTLAAGGRDHRPDDLRGPPSGHRAAARR